MIKVGKKSDRNAIYIGRPSPLGNPFPMQNHTTEERDRVCDLYQEWFDRKINAGDTEILAALHAIPHDAILGCYCFPLRCHGDTIKRYLDEHTSGISLFTYN